MDSSFNNYTNSCECGGSYDGLNCAHFLSNSLINAGFTELKTKDGLYRCPGLRPIRSKELRDWFKEKWGFPHSEPPKEGCCMVYQQKGNQGHVLMRKYTNGEYKYCGTDHPDWEIQQYYY